MTKFQLSLLFGFVLITLSCAKPPEQSPNALPTAWYKTETTQSTAGAPVQPTGPDVTPMPNAVADESVRTQFMVHTSALEDLASAPTRVAKPAAQHQADWTPWHMDGMIASFAVDVGGIFGVLTADGTATVKGTWQQSAPAGPKAVKPLKKNSLRLSAEMSLSDLKRALEPSIRTAIATHAMGNESELRRNLSARGSDFLQLVKVLDGVPARPGWHVDSLQLQLTFDADGQLTPVVGIGGQLNVFLDWQKSSVAGTKGAIRTGELFRNVVAFAQSLGALIPEALLDAKAIRSSGLALDQFQVGVAVIEGAQIGVVQNTNTIQGKIIFKRDKGAKDTDTASSVSQLAARETAMSDVSKPAWQAQAIPFVMRVGAPQAFAAASSGTGVGQIESSNAQLTLVQVPVDAFRAGLSRAVQMGSYFAQRAEEADTRRWQVTQIETEFDASVGGAFKLATVTSQGQFVLDFDRIGK